MKREIFVVDDHPVMRLGYIALLDQDPSLHVCGEADTALEALEQISTLHPDLVITDILLEGLNGIELTKRLQQQHPGLPVLIVSMCDEAIYGERALQAGARGYIMKREARTKIVEAVRRTLSEGFYLSGSMSQKILLRYRDRGFEGRAAIEQLSDRELEVFEHLGRGRTTQEIAEAMLISPKTVASHRSRIKEKLDIGNTGELLRQAVLWARS